MDFHRSSHQYCVHRCDKFGTTGYTEFPAYSQVFPNFRTLVTVIVTAAVYWGLDSKLRLAANLSS